MISLLNDYIRSGESIQLPNTPFTTPEHDLRTPVPLGPPRALTETPTASIPSRTCPEQLGNFAAPS